MDIWGGTGYRTLVKLHWRRSMQLVDAIERSGNFNLSCLPKKCKQIYPPMFNIVKKSSALITLTPFPSNVSQRARAGLRTLRSLVNFRNREIQFYLFRLQNPRTS